MMTIDMKPGWAVLLLMLLTFPAQANVEMFYLHNDHLGTPRVVTNQAQEVVWKGHVKPFGEMEVEIETITNHRRFPGQHFDIESRLHYNYFRDYDPGLGRYIQSDPIGLEGGFNTYAYVGGNPILFSDPYGLVQGSVTVDISGIVGPFGGSRSGGLAFDHQGNICSVYTTCQTNGEPKGKDGAFGFFAAGAFGASVGEGTLCDGSTESTKDSLEGAFLGAFQGSINKDEHENYSGAKGFFGFGYGFSIKTEQCTTSVKCF